MYTIHVGSTVIFRSFNRALSRRVYNLYKALYAWGQDAVRVSYVPTVMK